MRARPARANRRPSGGERWRRATPRRRSPTATSSPRAAATSCRNTLSGSRPSSPGPAQPPPVVIVGRRHHGPHGRLRARALRHPAVLLDEDNTVGVKGASSRGICYAEVAGDLRAPGRLRPHRRQGHPVERGPHLRRQGRGAPSTCASRAPSTCPPSRPSSTSSSSTSRATWSSASTSWATWSCAGRTGHRLPAGQRVRHAHRQHAGGRLPAARRPRDRRDRRPQPLPQVAGRLGHREEGRRPLVHRRRALPQAPAGGAPHWIEAPFNENRAVWQHLMGDDVWRIDYQMAPDADPAR